LFGNDHIGEDFLFSRSGPAILQSPSHNHQGGDLQGLLKDRVALITGGTRGIGKAIVDAFLDEGARVSFSGANAANVEGLKAQLVSQRADGLVADLSDIKSPNYLVEETVKRFGRIDILVNNAGVGSRTDEWTLTPDEWDHVHTINLRAVFFLCQAAAVHMKAIGSGAIVNVSSIAGQNGGIAGSPAYASSKAGVIAITRALARRYGPLGIRVNCISPADIETDMTQGWPHELRQRLIVMTPLGRFGEVAEVGRAAVFLASDQATYITGQTLSINGGALMQ
jgi:3-oxoacyl-[acyl-carrier protein] reductase